MLRVVQKEDEIKYFQQLFANKIIETQPQKTEVIIGFQGGNVTREVYWLQEFGLWVLIQQIWEERFWNAFGTDDPLINKNISITCEINFPFEGINRRISGAFAQDEKGDVFLIHRGRIGGGKKGIGKNLFYENYRGKTGKAQFGKYVDEVAIIDSLTSDRFVLKLADFVYEITRIKKLIKYSM